MAKASREKGRRRENQIAAKHTDAGIRAERVSAMYRPGADLDLYPRGTDTAWIGEVKARANGEGFATLERWLGANDCLFLWRDRAEPLVVLPMSRWLEVAK